MHTLLGLGCGAFGAAALAHLGSSVIGSSMLTQGCCVASLLRRFSPPLAAPGTTAPRVPICPCSGTARRTVPSRQPHR